MHSAEIGKGYPGSIFFTCKAPEFTRNAWNVVHGGALSTYVDMVTTIAIYGFDEKGRGQVSAKLDMDFMNTADIG